MTIQNLNYLKYYNLSSSTVLLGNLLIFAFLLFEGFSPLKCLKIMSIWSHTLCVIGPMFSLFRWFEHTPVPEKKIAAWQSTSRKSDSWTLIWRWNLYLLSLMSTCTRSLFIFFLSCWIIFMSTNRTATDGKSPIISFLTFLTFKNSFFVIETLVSVTRSMKRKTAFKAIPQTYDSTTD